MEQPHKLLTSSRCWAAAWRHGRIPDFYPRLAAPLPDKGSTRQLRFCDDQQRHAGRPSPRGYPNTSRLLHPDLHAPA